MISISKFSNLDDKTKYAIALFYAGEPFAASTGICGSDTYGYGDLSDNGYFEYQIPAEIAKRDRKVTIISKIEKYFDLSETLPKVTREVVLVVNRECTGPEVSEILNRKFGFKNIGFVVNENFEFVTYDHISDQKNASKFTQTQTFYSFSHSTLKNN